MKSLFTILLVPFFFFLCSCAHDEPFKATHVDPQRSDPKPEAVALRDKIVILSDTADYLRLEVAVDGDDPSFAALLKEHLQDSLTSTPHARIQSTGESELKLTLTPRFEQIEVMGEYYRTKCQVAGAIHQPATGRLLASTHFDFDSGKRVMGAVKAREQYAATAGKTAGTWAVNQINDIRQHLLSVSVIRFALHDTNLSGRRAEDSRAVLKLGKMIGAIKGVLSCQLTEQDFTQGTCAFRVVYYAESFPMGLTNIVTTMLQ